MVEKVDNQDDEDHLNKSSDSGESNQVIDSKDVKSLKKKLNLLQNK